MNANDELNRYARKQSTAQVLLWYGVPSTLLGALFLLSSFTARMTFSPEVRSRIPYSEVQRGSPGLVAAVGEVSRWKWTKVLGVLLTVTGGMAWWVGARMDQQTNANR